MIKSYVDWPYYKVRKSETWPDPAKCQVRREHSFVLDSIFDKNSCVCPERISYMRAASSTFIAAGASFRFFSSTFSVDDYLHRRTSPLHSRSFLILAAGCTLIVVVRRDICGTAYEFWL